jgi:integrase
MEQWTLHDLRRTARSMLSRLVTPHIAERVLGHSIGGVEGTYGRYTYDAEKTDALAKLAAAVDRIINPPEGDNVVPLRVSS